MEGNTCCNEVFALQYLLDDGVWHLCCTEINKNPAPIVSQSKEYLQHIIDNKAELLPDMNFELRWARYTLIDDGGTN